MAPRTANQLAEVPRIRFTNLFAERIGGVDSVDVEAATIESALHALTDRHPDLTTLVWAKDGKLNPVMVVFLNDQQLGAAEMGKPVGPGDEIERANMRRRLTMLRERATAAGALAEQAMRLAEELAETPRHSGRPCWVHGDLYARHLLLDETRLPSGVIDWGDVHLGDPALDLSVAISFLPPAAELNTVLPKK